MRISSEVVNENKWWPRFCPILCQHTQLNNLLKSGEPLCLSYLVVRVYFRMFLSFTLFLSWLKDYVFPITTIRTISVTFDVFPVFDFPTVSVQDKCTILLRLICHLAAYSIGFYLVGRQQNCQRFIFWNCYWFTVNRVADGISGRDSLEPLLISF